MQNGRAPSDSAINAITPNCGLGFAQQLVAAARFELTRTRSSARQGDLRVVRSFRRNELLGHLRGVFAGYEFVTVTRPEDSSQQDNYHWQRRKWQRQKDCA
jgi:hypothetical protein